MVKNRFTYRAHLASISCDFGTLKRTYTFIQILCIYIDIFWCPPTFTVYSSTMATVLMAKYLIESEVVTLANAKEDLADSDGSVVDSDSSTDDEEGKVNIQL